MLRGAGRSVTSRAVTGFAVEFLGCKVSQADAMLARGALLAAGHTGPPASRPTRAERAALRREPLTRLPGEYPESGVMTTITEQLRTDMTGAMKAGEKERVGALRLVLSELQKAAKDGSDDELAVLRRERKRRLEAAEQFRDAGRPELADQEESEAELIAGYLPAELSDDELDAIVERGDRRDRAPAARATWAR